MDWLEILIRTYLERDIPQMVFHVPAARLRRLWTMLAHLQGETINYSRLAANLEVDANTVSHYIDILTDLLLVRRLEPRHVNVKKRLVKSPRFYVRDSGILHRLLGINTYDAQTGSIARRIAARRYASAVKHTSIQIENNMRRLCSVWNGDHNAAPRDQGLVATLCSLSTSPVGTNTYLSNNRSVFPGIQGYAWPYREIPCPCMCNIDTLISHP